MTRKSLVDASPAKATEIERAWMRGNVRRAYEEDRVAEVSPLALDGLLNERDRLEWENYHFRQLLWLRHGCSGPALYGDDGELQCRACSIDFKRLPVEQIERIFARKNIEVLDAALHERAAE